MIRVGITRRHTYTFDKYLDAHAGAWRGRLVPDPYDEMLRRKPALPGTYIFTDLDRLSRRQRAKADRLADALQAAGMRVLNQPRAWLSRLTLIQALHADGLLPYRGFRLSKAPPDLRYPVFLRLENDHQGTRTPLIESPEGFAPQLKRLRHKGKWRRTLIVIEMQDTADETGLVRKYGAFRVGDRIIARHLFFGRLWALKHPHVFGEEQLAEEWDYVRENPHEAQLLELFDRAGLEYGRADYAMVDGRVCLWEINSNPGISSMDDLVDGIRATTCRVFRERMDAAWTAIEGSAESAPIVW